MGIIKSDEEGCEKRKKGVIKSLIVMSVVRSIVVVTSVVDSNEMRVGPFLLVMRTRRLLLEMRDVGRPNGDAGRSPPRRVARLSLFSRFYCFSLFVSSSFTFCYPPFSSFPRLFFVFEYFLKKSKVVKNHGR